MPAAGANVGGGATGSGGWRGVPVLPGGHDRGDRGPGGTALTLFGLRWVALERSVMEVRGSILPGTGPRGSGLDRRRRRPGSGALGRGLADRDPAGPGARGRPSSRSWPRRPTVPVEHVRPGAPLSASTGGRRRGSRPMADAAPPRPRRGSATRSSTRSSPTASRARRAARQARTARGVGRAADPARLQGRRPPRDRRAPRRAGRPRASPRST